MEVITQKEATQKLGGELHAISFGEIFEVDNLNWDEVAGRLRQYDAELQRKQVLLLKRLYPGCS